MDNKLRVAAYCRVGSVESDTTSKYEIAKRHYENLVEAHKDWHLCDVSDKKRVAAYVRINSDRMGSAAKSQYIQLSDEIQSHEDWEFAGVYIDVGDRHHCEAFLKLIEDCENGKADMIITPTAARFGRTIVDAMNTVRRLYLRRPQVGVYFQKENLSSLDGDNGVPAMMFLHHMVMAQGKQKKTAYAAARV
jgi:DNA invertase Pin-like site-specific DNA recombinase